MVQTNKEVALRKPLAIAIVTAVLVTLTATSAAQARKEHVRYSTQQINVLVRETRHLERVMGSPLTPTIHKYAHTRSAAYKRWAWWHWHRILMHTKHQYKHYLRTHRQASDMGAWLCIHHYEGSWTDPNAPYWGGLQMDWGFQTTYGSEFMKRYGTADHWPIIDQIIAARRARDGYGGYGSRGYSPWSHTAALCGLL